MFENVKARRIDLKEAKRILNINGNMYSDEEVKKIVDFLYDFADLSAERLESNRKSSWFNPIAMCAATEFP